MCCDDPVRKYEENGLPVINRKLYIEVMVATGVPADRAERDFEYDASRKKIVEAKCCAA